MTMGKEIFFRKKAPLTTAVEMTIVFKKGDEIFDAVKMDPFL